jgi:ATP-dependent RNA helicase RhlE
VSIDEKPLLNGIEKLIRQTLRREMIDGFEPDANFAPAPLKPAQKPRPPRKPIAKPGVKPAAKSGFKPQGNRAATSSKRSKMN